MNLKQQIDYFASGRQRSISSASLVLAVSFALSGLLGYLRTRFLYARFYSCCAANLDAYNAAFRLPDLIFKLLVTGALSASFIPVFSTYSHKSQNTANRIASTVINLLLIVFPVVSFVIFIFARPLSQLAASGFTPDQINLMVSLTRILLLAQIFFLVSNFLTSILQSYQSFLMPALSPIIYNLSIILSIFTLAPRFGLQGVAFGAVVGAFFHFLIQIPAIKKTKFTYLFIVQPNLPGVREVIRLMIPRTLALGLSEIQNSIVTLFFASQLPVGSLSLLDLALFVLNYPIRIFSTTVGQAALPILAKNIAANDLKSFRQTISRILLQSLYLTAPLAVLLLIQRLSVVRIAFGAKQFPWSATLLTAKALAFLAPVIIFQSISQILIRAFYALHNTKTPFYVSLVSLLVNLVASFYFINYTSLGIAGLAIATSMRELALTAGLIFVFIKQVDGLEWVSTLNRSLKILAASLFSGSLTYALVKILDQFLLNTTRVLPLVALFCVSSLVGVLSYLLASKLLQLQERLSYHRLFGKIKTFLYSK